MNRAVGQYQEALDICNCSPREEEMGDKKKKTFEEIIEKSPNLVKI